MHMHVHRHPHTSPAYNTAVRAPRVFRERWEPPVPPGQPCSWTAAAVLGGQILQHTISDR